MRKRIRIVVADDQPLARSSVAFLLNTNTDLEVVGEAEDGCQAVELARSHQPDVVIMDYDMPRLNGVDATLQIAKVSPQSRVIGHSHYDSQEVANAMLQAGAAAFVPKHISLASLIDAIRETAS